MSKNDQIIYTPEETESTQGAEQKLKKLRHKLKECQKEKEGYLDLAQRARADLINYRNRQEKILEECRTYGQSGLLKELLPVLDSLESGSQEIEKIKPIKEQLIAILARHGLKEIKAKGEKFNPQFHEAIEQAEAKDKSGLVLDELQKGYLLGDKILRPSKVKVGK